MAYAISLPILHPAFRMSKYALHHGVLHSRRVPRGLQAGEESRICYVHIIFESQSLSTVFEPFVNRTRVLIDTLFCADILYKSP